MNLSIHASKKWVEISFTENQTKRKTHTRSRTTRYRPLQDYCRAPGGILLHQIITQYKNIPLARFSNAISRRFLSTRRPNWGRVSIKGVRRSRTSTIERRPSLMLGSRIPGYGRKRNFGIKSYRPAITIRLIIR